MFNVAEFAAVISEKDVLRNNFFLFRCFLPNGLLGTEQRIPNLPTTHDLEYWCEAVDLPGVSLQTHEGARFGYGAMERRPTTVTPFQPLRCTFISDGEADNFHFFYTWMNLIYNFMMDQGINSIPGRVTDGFFGPPNRPYEPYFVTYPSAYCVDINILVFDKTGRQKMNIICREAFPVSMDNPALNWQDNNTYARLNIHFSFTDWYALPPNTYEQLDSFPEFIIGVEF